MTSPPKRYELGVIASMRTNLDGEVMISDEAVAWFFMGEGCFTISLEKNRNHSKWKEWLRPVPKIILVNTDRELLEEIKKWLETKGLPAWLYKRKVAGNRKNAYQLIMSSGFKRSKRLVNFLLPYLKGTKKEEGILFKQFVERFERKGGGSNSPKFIQKEKERFAEILNWIHRFGMLNPNKRRRGARYERLYQLFSSCSLI